MSRKNPPPETASQPGVRLDKWLWAARLYKTRGLAVEDIEHNRVRIGDQPVKASREVRVGDIISLRQREQNPQRVLRVLALSSVRGPAPVAQGLYEETAESRVAREHAQEQRRLTPEPAQSIEQGRPTKHDRRQLDAHQQAQWQRWRASFDGRQLTHRRAMVA